MGCAVAVQRRVPALSPSGWRTESYKRPLLIPLLEYRCAILAAPRQEPGVTAPEEGEIWEQKCACVTQLIKVTLQPQKEPRSKSKVAETWTKDKPHLLQDLKGNQRLWETSKNGADFCICNSLSTFSALAAGEGDTHQRESRNTHGWEAEPFLNGPKCPWCLQSRCSIVLVPGSPARSACSPGAGWAGSRHLSARKEQRQI